MSSSCRGSGSDTRVTPRAQAGPSLRPSERRPGGDDTVNTACLWARSALNNCSIRATLADNDLGDTSFQVPLKRGPKVNDLEARRLLVAQGCFSASRFPPPAPGRAGTRPARGRKTAPPLRGAAFVPLGGVSPDNIFVYLHVPARIHPGLSDSRSPWDSDSARIPWWLLGRGPLRACVSGTEFATREF